LQSSLATIRALHDAGVPIVAGTDEGIPGFSVYRELELYVMAGFSPMDALRAATSVSAAALHLEHEVGTLEAGKVADLLVLDKNPLDNISNIRTQRYVMKDGRMFESSALWKVAGFTP
jgi:imidazolonepropionase-like amidohydrolase